MNQPDTWEKRFDKLRDPDDCMHEEKKNYVKKLLTTTKANWLRSEIEKLEGETKGLVTLNCYGNCNPRCHDSGKDIALTTIITRYKEELKVLENGK